MKVCIFMARGLEGCGVTKFSLEQRDWFIKNGHEVTLVYAKDKSFTRNCAHDYKSFSIPVLLAKEYDKTLKLVNDCDILIINSVLRLKKTLLITIKKLLITLNLLFVL